MSLIMKPTVIMPYSPYEKDENVQDVFVYLRPESNGIKVESTMLRVIQENSQYKTNTKLIYLANIPGDFINKNNIIEQHYRVRIKFTKYGKELFTPHMKEAFESYFHADFSSSKIVGAFEAMDLLNMDWSGLFNLWVPRSDMMEVNGQTIKRVEDIFIINYDIPALLTKNSSETNIAVMVFRTTLRYNEFSAMINDMGEALINAEILNPKVPISRVFHYSKGPFEQILDAIGFLYDTQYRHVPLVRIGFCSYLLSRGVSMYKILQALRNRIMRFRIGEGYYLEEDIIAFTVGDSYAEAYEKYKSIVSQVII